MITLQPATPKVHATPSERAALALEQLQSLLSQERQLLNSGSVSGLDWIATQKQQLMSDLRLSLAQGGPTQPPNTQGLSSFWRPLREDLAMAATLNRDNGLLANRQLDYLRIRQCGLMSAGGVPESYRYDGSGATQCRSPSSLGIA